MASIIERWQLRALCVACWLGIIGSAQAVFPPPIKDDGKFFNPETLEKAAKKIRDIYSTYFKDVVIETFAAIPADLEKKYKEEGKSFFREWAEKRVEELGVNGLYILIVREPGHLQVTENKRTRAKLFTGKDEGKLIEKMLAAFKEKKFDDGLLDGLDFVQSALKANTGK